MLSHTSISVCSEAIKVIIQSLLFLFIYMKIQIKATKWINLFINNTYTEQLPSMPNCDQICHNYFHEDKNEAEFSLIVKRPVCLFSRRSYRSIYHSYMSTWVAFNSSTMLELETGWKLLYD